MLSVGLVGLPNAGKSTLFNLLTKRQVSAENFPFCTIEPNSGIVEVPDDRVASLSKISDSAKEVYAGIEFVDIAGLVKDASSGAGLGNQFLSHIKEVDLILLVIRCFENQKVIHVENRVNPQEDQEILELELILADQQMLEKTLPRIEKESKTSKDKLSSEKIQIVQKILEKLSANEPAKSYQIDETADNELHKWRKGLNLLTDKPVLRLANINQEGQNIEYQSDFDLDILLESSISDMTSEERQELEISEQTGLDKMIKACYNRLNLATFLTTGKTESRAWTFTNGMTAPQCASKIHTDFEKTFIKAEVIGYDDFLTAGSWKKAIENGKLRSEGKNYVMQDGDIVEFKVGA
ncbi:MAG: redox-regulated ATPase YchF [Patescibacteria group bacterium]